eukprot:4196857-Amphidinium_carterae.2
MTDGQTHMTCSYVVRCGHFAQQHTGLEATRLEPDVACWEKLAFQFGRHPGLQVKLRLLLAPSVSTTLPCLWRRLGQRILTWQPFDRLAGPNQSQPWGRFARRSSAQEKQNATRGKLRKHAPKSGSPICSASTAKVEHANQETKATSIGLIPSGVPSRGSLSGCACA